MVPDLDIFIRSSTNPTLFLQYHRNFTHALAFAPIGALIVAGLFLLLFKSLRGKWPYVLLGAFVAYLTHGILDSATSYGTLLWWPFSDRRVAWDLISIIDPVFTLFLVIGVIVAYKKQVRYPTVIALFACVIYLGFGYWQHSRALNAQAALAATRHQSITKGRVMPELATLYRYRSVYIDNQQIYIDQIMTPLFQSTIAITGTATPLFVADDLPDAIKHSALLLNDYTIFDWFSDGYVTALSQHPLILADVRYLRSLQPLRTNWVIQFPSDPSRKHVYWQSHLR